MRTRINILFLLMLFWGTDAHLFCQEKTQSYYNQHPEEILQDAQISFKKGEYEKTISLCKLHYIIVGDSAADALRGKAELCERLTNEIKEKTEELRTANPDDPFASKLNPDDAAISDKITDSKSSEGNELGTIIQDEKDINGYQWVDLGLPSGLKWATKNIGAQTNGDLGFFYSQKEAATISVGTTWRIPNDKDWEELKMFCDWRWMIMYGHPGYLVVSIKNRNSIFLPASGYFGTKGNRDALQQGYYWSAPTKNGEQREGNCFFFNMNRIEMNTFPPSYRLSIRAVSD